MNKLKTTGLVLLLVVTVILVFFTLKKATGKNDDDDLPVEAGVTEGAVPMSTIQPVPSSSAEAGDSKGGLSSVIGLDLTPTSVPNGENGDGNGSVEELDSDGWDGSDLLDTLNLPRLNEVAAKLYSESLDGSYMVTPQMPSEEEMEKFESETIYYNDRFGYLYLNMKLIVTDAGGSEKVEYVTFKLGYEGTHLKIYDVVVR